MAATGKKFHGNFGIDTATFCEIWSNHIGVGTKKGDDDWRRFCLNIFNHFSDSSTEGKKNHAHLTSVDAGWAKWNEEAQYNFVSNKCYAKCISIKKKLEDKEGFEIDLPAGYKNRNSTSSTRVSMEEMIAIFMS
jgi:hypothetical protein